MPEVTSPPSPPPSSTLPSTKFDLTQPKTRPRRRSRSADPVLRSSSAPDFVPPFSRPPPTPPRTAGGESEASTVVALALETPLPTRDPPAPPPPPHLVEIRTEEEEKELQIEAVSPVMRSTSESRRPLVPVQRQFSETPAPSTLSRLMEEEGIVRPSSVPMLNLPPSPPLTRRSTTKSSTSKYPLAAIGTTAASLKPYQVEPRVSSPTYSIPRPSTASSSSASIKEVRHLGKQLGKNPIDYLIPNGSLPAPVSPFFHPTKNPHLLTPEPESANPVAGIFGNLNFLLDSYLSVLSAGGSLAVGTGYRSVARRLLERVEGMFARDLGVDDVGWAEVLEYIRGTRPRPPLCVLPVRGLLSQSQRPASEIHPGDSRRKDLAESVVAGVKEKTTMGKVNDWLEEVEKVLQDQSQCGGSSEQPHGGIVVAASTAVEEQEDEMVCQIIEGILPNDAQISLFRSYLADNTLLVSTKQSLIRLYPDHPQASITAPVIALYLLLHPSLHSLLKAISNVSDAELDLINSGRFDAFLDGSTNVVARDEEEELTVITSLDKRLWSVLEGLEDEIEELHNRALVIRRALKERREVIAKKRRTSSSSISPSAAAAAGLLGNIDKLTDLRTAAEEEEGQDGIGTLEDAWGSWEGKSLVITPDDSASNITYNRRRRAERASKRDESERRRDKEERKREKKELRRKEEDAGRKSARASTDEPATGENSTVVGGSSSRRSKKERKDREDRKDHHHRKSEDSKKDNHSSSIPTFPSTTTTTTTSNIEKEPSSATTATDPKKDYGGGGGSNNKKEKEKSSSGLGLSLERFTNGLKDLKDFKVSSNSNSTKDKDKGEKGGEKDKGEKERDCKKCREFLECKECECDGFVDGRRPHTAGSGREGKRGGGGGGGGGG